MDRLLGWTQIASCIATLTLATGCRDESAKDVRSVPGAGVTGRYVRIEFSGNYLHLARSRR